MTIGVTIRDLLIANTSLTALVPAASIFPRIANEDTALPLIIYRSSIEPEYDKDGWVSDDCSFEIMAISNDFSNLQLVSTEVRTALECVRATGTDRIEMTGMDEGNDLNGVFWNVLSFQVKIKSY